jgi:hypothetical protein
MFGRNLISAMVEFEIKGIKCDHCDYRDDDVKFSEYPDYINQQCPLCYHNLLTKEEYHSCIRQYAFIAKYNKVMNILKWVNPMHYWRLLFGDNRRKTQVTVKFLNDKK